MCSYLPKSAVHLIIVVTLLANVLAADTSPNASRGQTPSQKVVNTLRGVYYATPPEGPATDVGRLAILLLMANGPPQQVSLHHRFHSGESFKFIVSSNRDGWLYILHRSPGGELQLLWPRVENNGPVSHLDNNRVEAGKDVTVPASPGKFTFDSEIGSEDFYIVIRSNRKPPELTTSETSPVNGNRTSAVATPPLEHKKSSSAGLAKTDPDRLTEAPAGQKIVQFSVRGPKNPIRGVVYDPGPQDQDPHTYFAAHPENENSDVVFEFKLLHTE